MRFRRGDRRRGGPDLRSRARPVRAPRSMNNTVRAQRGTQFRVVGCAVSDRYGRSDIAVRADDVQPIGSQSSVRVGTEADRPVEPIGNDAWACFLAAAIGVKLPCE